MQYFGSFHNVAGERRIVGLFRRAIAGDLTTDAVLRKDGEWHFTSKLSLWMAGQGDEDLAEVSESEAQEFVARIRTL